MPDDIPTHILFDEINWNIVLSPNLIPIFEFLMNIEKDIEFLLKQEERIGIIKEELNKLLSYTWDIAKRAEDGGINLPFPKDINFDLLINQFEYRKPAIVWEMLSLFAFLETIYCLYIAYNLELSSKEEILEYTLNTKEKEKFIARFLLSTENWYFKKNSKFLWKITPKRIRNFRNSLVHFYSVSEWIGIVHKNNAKNARKIEEKLKWSHTVFISSLDLQSLLIEAAKLLLRNWSNDYLTDSKLFRKKIHFVSKIIEENGWKQIMDNQLNF